MNTARFVSFALIFAACAHTDAGPVSPAQLVAAEDRTDADRKLDEGRKPVEFLKFLAIKPGSKVAELSAGGGYTTELLARAVGPDGVVYGQNNKFMLDRFAQKPWTERLSRPVNKKVIRLDRELESPFPPELHDLDLVVSNAIYHDTVWLGADRAAMNAAVLAALKKGGHYVVCDSSAKEDAGVDVAKDLHRIPEAFVREEVSSAGFKLVSTGDFLRNPADTRDWNASPSAAGEKRGTSDRFCLKFEKP